MCELTDCLHITPIVDIWSVQLTILLSVRSTPGLAVRRTERFGSEYHFFLFAVCSLMLSSYLGRSSIVALPCTISPLSTAHLWTDGSSLAKTCINQHNRKSAQVVCRTSHYHNLMQSKLHSRKFYEAQRLRLWHKKLSCAGFSHRHFGTGPQETLPSSAPMPCPNLRPD